MPMQTPAPPPPDARKSTATAFEWTFNRSRESERDTSMSTEPATVCLCLRPHDLCAVSMDPKRCPACVASASGSERVSECSANILFICICVRYETWPSVVWAVSAVVHTNTEMRPARVRQRQHASPLDSIRCPMKTAHVVPGLVCRSAVSCASADFRHR